MHPRLAKDIARLRKRLPLLRPFKVIVREIPERLNAIGLCNLKSGRVVITLDDALSLREQQECLAHEWAHGVAWDLDKDDHGPHWGVAYARAYQIVFQVK